MSTDKIRSGQLRPVEFHILLSLASGERHGYGIIREVSERTDGVITLRSGTLYTLLQRLLAEGYPAYTTSAGWLGYDDEKVRRGVDPLMAGSRGEDDHVSSAYVDHGAVRGQQLFGSQRQRLAQRSG